MERWAVSSAGNNQLTMRQTRREASEEESGGILDDLIGAAGKYLGR